MTAQAFFAIADTAEQRLCRFANRGCRRTTIRTLFRVVSRLGDGVFWYTLIAIMPFIFGLNRLQDGLLASLHMLCAGAGSIRSVAKHKKRVQKVAQQEQCDDDIQFKLRRGSLHALNFVCTGGSARRASDSPRFSEIIGRALQR